MTTRHAINVLAAAAAIQCAAVHAQTQFPTKPIRIASSEAGGVNDVATRLIAQGVSASVGQPVIVDNRGGGTVAGEFVARSASDGYTLLSYGNTLWLLPLMRDNVPYDPMKDFVPVATTARGVTVLIVHPSLPVKSVKELIALGRARPGQLNYGSGAVGTSNHLAAELFKSMAKVNITRVGYKGVASALNSLISGELQVMFPQLGSVMPHMSSGRVRALAVTSAKPTTLAPGLPTVAAAGLPGYEASGTFAILAPARTPPATIARLNQEIVAVLEKPETRERFERAGLEVVASTPDELAATMRSEIAVMGKVIREGNIRE